MPAPANMRLLPDNNVPVAIARYLPQHDVVHASSLGGRTLANGDLIAAADEAGFDILLTADQNIEYQQNLAGRRLAIIVLATNHWNTIRGNMERVISALDAARQQAFVRVSFPVPVRRRRPSASSDC